MALGRPFGATARGRACVAARRRSAAAPALLAVLLLVSHARLAVAQTAATSCLPTTGTLTALAASGGCAVTLTVNDTFSGFSPLVIGVNLGHHYPQEGSWLAYLEHLGVNGARPTAQPHGWQLARRALCRANARARPAPTRRAPRRSVKEAARRAQRGPQRLGAARTVLTRFLAPWQGRATSAWAAWA
jgi:hypothetical protein